MPLDEESKVCFVMEMPGYTLDPDSFNPLKFDPRTGMSPDCARALLCDRVPALAPYFYDTGNHISFFWKLLLDTYTIKRKCIKNAEEEANYEEAIKVLYGSPDRYIFQQKSTLYKSIDKLRDHLDAAIKHDGDEILKHKKSSPENCTSPLLEKVKDAPSEYSKLKLQIGRYEKAIFSNNGEDLDTLLMEHANSKKQISLVCVLLLYIHLEYSLL